jgi:hypothetical protein
MSKGPSKLLYTCGGWFLGGLVGGLLGVAAALGLAYVGVGVGAAVVAGQAISLISSIAGAVKGYKKAAHERQEYQAVHYSGNVRHASGMYADMALELGEPSAEQYKPKLRGTGYADAIAAERLNAPDAEMTR